MAGSKDTTFRVQIASNDPNAEPYWQSVTFTPGALTLWEMRGPERQDGTARNAHYFDKEATLADISWLVWRCLGGEKELGDFDDFVMRILDIGEGPEEASAGTDPKALPTS